MALKCNEYEFLKKLADTRNGYSHLISPYKQYMMQKGGEMVMIFDIILYPLRF